ncbi:MAG: ThuA domain-containing protein, partial [Planctomycetes bacterium]|nr:ThuA domain-containing protein [Planctomycetota bacterium]
MECGRLGIGVAAAIAATLCLGSPAEAGAKRRVVYYSQTEGFRHGEGIAAALKVLQDAAAKDDATIEVEECTDCSKWTPEYLGKFDAMASYGGGELTKVKPPLADENKKALIEFVKGGKGFVAIHSASYMCPQTKWPEYDEMVNGVFVSHPWSQKVRMIVEDAKHPSTAHLGEAFEVVDEIYMFIPWSREKTHVLISLDNGSVDVAKKGLREDKDFGIAWCHPFGKGKVFYTALGHGRNVWAEERFQKHLLNGLLWAMGDLPGEATLGTDGR